MSIIPLFEALRVDSLALLDLNKIGPQVPAIENLICGERHLISHFFQSQIIADPGHLRTSRAGA